MVWCVGLLFLGPGFNCLWTGYWYHYNLLPPEIRERVDRGEEQVHRNLLKLSNVRSNQSTFKFVFCLKVVFKEYYGENIIQKFQLKSVFNVDLKVQ